MADIQKEEQQAEKRIEEMEQKTFDISFQHEGKSYTGWVTPSSKTGDTENATSYHVVLNDVFFGNLSLSNKQWVADTQREEGLIQAAGRQIEKHNS